MKSPVVPSTQEIIFRQFFSFSVLFHFHLQMLTDPFSVACTLAAVYLMVIPSSKLFLNSLLLLVIIQVLNCLPEIPNHWLLSGIIASCYLTSRSFESFKSTSLLSTSIFYFFAFFWKLNSDYINPEFSCVSQFYQNIKLLLSYLPDSQLIIELSIWGSIFVELLLAVGLLFPRYWRITLFTGFIFHLILSVDQIKHFSNFSSLMFSLLILAAPSSQFEPIKKGVIYIPLVSKFFLNTFSAWIIYLAVPIIVVTKAIFSKQEELSVKNSGKIILLFPLIVFLNGASPYLGLKNRSSWQMYSNLRLEADSGNHFLINKSLDLLGYLSEPVEILSLEGFAPLKAGQIITRHDLSRIISKYPEANIGFKYQYPEKNQSLKKDSWIFNELSWFNELGPEAAKQCVW